MTKRFLWAVCVIFLWGSCSGPQRKNDEFTETKHLKAEFVDLDEILYPEFMTIKGDHLILASSKNSSALFSYATPSLTFESNFGIKGRGPNEIQVFPMFCESPGATNLYVWGYTPVAIKKIAVADSGDVDYTGDVPLKKYEAFNNMAVIGDSLFVYYLPDELTVKKYNLKNNEEADIVLPKDDHLETYFYSNRGYIATSDSEVIYSYLFKKQINIYDLATLELKYRISDGAKYPKPVPGDFSSLVYNYTGLYAGEKYFYALYDGSKADGHSLETYNYNGDPVIKYYFDITPGLFVVDEKNGKIYGYNDKHPDQLLRFDM